jgi:acyl-CoA reductase-like NAD-dependent aldehyde dehydrogenase
MNTLTQLATHWIGGRWVDAGEHRDSINPATGEVIGQYAAAGLAEAQGAIDAALSTFRKTSWKEDRLLRGRVLNTMANEFERRTEDLAQVLATENGKTLPQARFEISSVPRCLRFNAALALTDYGRTSSIEPGHLSLVTRQAVGVSGIIAPWNSPLALVIRSLAPALAAGTTAVVMLPGQAAQTNSLMSEIMASVKELPHGVVNTITGDREAGNLLVTSPDVPVISFTGGTATGRTISANAAPRLKRLGLELGGKTPMIIFDDADLRTAVNKVVEALIVFAGQFCMTGSRVLVQKAVAEQVRAELIKRLAAVKVGPASDPETEMGPVIDKPNVARISKMVEEAIAAGAKPLLRGGAVTEMPLAKGSFYRPTLLEVFDSSLPIVQKEVFGPVLTLQVFETEADAVALANNSEYGLSASVWSRDIDRPLRVAHELESGTVWVNDWGSLYDQFEEGGFKQSGQGRMRGLAVMEDFFEYKHIVLRPGYRLEGKGAV